MNTYDFILMKDWRPEKIDGLLRGDWISVQLIEDNDGEHGQTRETVMIFPVLVPRANLSTVMATSEWELDIPGDVQTGFVSWRNEAGQDEYKYQRYHWENGLEPFVIRRSHESQIKDYYEIIEEFRLFHNLYHYTDRNIYVMFNMGQEIEIVHVKPSHIRIRRKQLVQFLAAKQFCLVLYFDVLRLAQFDVNSLIAQEHKEIKHSETLIYKYDIQKWDHDFTANALLHGKIAVICPPLESSGIWPYNEIKNYVEFIIGVDEMGNEIITTADINVVTYKSSPNFLTPVYFKRDVLTKYFRDQKRYRVKDGRIVQIGAWSLRADTNHAEYIIVFLGDLGRELPYHEQMYWRSYNTSPPSDPRLSFTQTRRAFYGEWTEPEESALLFKYRFSNFQKAWYQKYGWHLFRPLNPDDDHYWTALHRPLNESLQELEDLALSLTKLLIDSLNVEELNKKITVTEKGMGSIKKLSNYLEAENVPNFKAYILTFTNIYHLRTHASAHRKDKVEYPRIVETLGIGKRSVFEIADDLLSELTGFLLILNHHFLE